MYFLSVFFCLENLQLLYLHMTVFCIYVFITINRLSNSIFIKLLILFQYFSITFSSLFICNLEQHCLITIKAFYTLNHYNNGLMSSLFLYPLKYLNELFYQTSCSVYSILYWMKKNVKNFLNQFAYVNRVKFLKQI